MTALTIKDINLLALDAAEEDRRQAPRCDIRPEWAARAAPEDHDPPTIVLGGQFKLEAYHHTREGEPPLLTAEQMLEDGPLAFVQKSIEEVGGLDSAREKLASLVRGGLDLNTYWHAYTYGETGYSDAYTPCARPGLHNACWADAGWVDLFADLGADLNIKSSNGDTAIRLAVTGGSPDVLAALLRRGAKDDPGEGNYTLLHEAAERNDIASCEVLLAAGASLVDRDKKRGETPLISAAAADSRAAFDFLLKRGASPRELDGKGNTAAHAAMGEDFPEMAFHAIEAGVDPDVLNVAGATALSMGSKTSQDRLQELLRVRKTRDAAREALASMDMVKGLAP